MKKYFMLTVVALLLVAMVGMAQAVPSSGVAAGTYMGDVACSTYLTCFTGAYSDTDGWALGSSPATLTVFTNASIGTDIWLLSAGAVDFSVTFGGSTKTSATITPTSGDHWDGYITPYSGINLGAVNTTDWAALNNAVMNPDQFYGLALSLAYSGTLTSDNYFFAVSDDNGTTGLQAQGGRNFDAFSPKTTSSHPGQVPEPGTLLLFGSGLMGLGIFGRKKFGK